MNSIMDNVNDIIDMLKDRLVEATRKTSRINLDRCEADENGMPSLYSFAELIEAQELENQIRSILYAILVVNLYWLEDDQEFLELAY